MSGTTTNLAAYQTSSHEVDPSLRSGEIIRAAGEFVPGAVVEIRHSVAPQPVESAHERSLPSANFVPSPPQVTDTTKPVAQATAAVRRALSQPEASTERLAGLLYEGMISDGQSVLNMRSSVRVVPEQELV